MFIRRTSVDNITVLYAAIVFLETKMVFGFKFRFFSQLPVNILFFNLITIRIKTFVFDFIIYSHV